MKPIQFLSGDPVVDRRADYAQMLFASGDSAAACEVLADALALAPGWAAGWFRLGEMREAAGDAGGAVETWRKALELDASDAMGAALKLRLAGEPVRDVAPGAFVRALFDQYAPRFEAELVGKLGYRVPDRLAGTLAKLRPAGFARALDLGCGTGLMGERLRPLVARLEGCDLSPEMLRRARAKGVYDELFEADLTQLSLPAGSYDLVTAADVFIYVGALDAVVAHMAAALTPGGVLAFSVERHDGPEPVRLGASRRYAHSPACVRALLHETGLHIGHEDTTPIRRDRGEDVPGFTVVAVAD